MKKFVLILIGLTILATGCSSLKKRAEGPLSTTGSPEAAALFERLKSRNSDLRSFKGTGRMRMEGGNGVQHARLMWAGYQNEKLRLEVMGGTGRPVFSFTDDGKRIYLISHTENRFYSRRSLNATLEKLISLPITVSACLDLLAGRIPAGTQLLPMTVQQGDVEGEQILMLEGLKRASGSQKVYVDASSGDIHRIEVRGGDDTLVYKVDFVRMQFISGFKVPVELRISNGKEVSLRIVVERFWPNVQVSDDLFILAKPH